MGFNSQTPDMRAEKRFFEIVIELINCSISRSFDLGFLFWKSVEFPAECFDSLKGISLNKHIPLLEF